MPPKKKKGKGKGKKKKKKGDEKTELTIEDKYKRTLEEIECLKDELATRTELTRRARDTAERMKGKMLEAKEEVGTEQQNKLDISSDLTRQYKTMQSEMALRIHMLEQTVTKLRGQLASTEEELQKTRKERDDMRREKDQIISELKFKIEHMESVYESILHDAFDKMTLKVDEARSKWETQSSEIQERNKQILLEFGLNPLEI
ncbi:coiled-coil domain-containing protein 153 [Nematostella vectensis]|uniref:coiled-coil domain-containing protein 153 n=1 Tax=Nematostella vectensis TaxID=45351 RepID=UPI002076EFC5|nr:coiled-coil domain-containing protein 153 [Nematostella vectensis]